MAIKFYRQKYSYDCGPTALKIVLSFYDKYINDWNITEKKSCSSKGWTINDFCETSSSLGLKTIADEIDFSSLSKISLPIVLLVKEHFIVLYKVKRNKFYIADPKRGKIIYTINEFSNIINNQLIPSISFEPTPKLQNINFKRNNYLQSFRFLKSYFIPYKREIIKLVFLVFIVTTSQLCIPFISKAVIDIGVETSSWSFIKLMLIANAILVLTTILGTFLQTFLLTHITNRIKVAMLDDFVVKLLKLPLPFFERTNIGDVIQRIRDNERIQSYLINTFFISFISFLLLILFSVILLYFNTTLFLVYIVSAILYIAWTCLFLNQRKKLDIRFYEILAQNNKKIIQIVNNIIDIKNFNYISKYRNQWRDNITEQHKQNITFLKFSQIQEVGSGILSYSKDIALTYISCYYVLNGDMTLGMLFSIQYIIGSLNAPLYKLVDFVNQTQLANISLTRLFDYNNLEDDVTEVKKENKFIPKDKNLKTSNLSFIYPDGSIGLKNISLYIKSNAKIGIVGYSGCGKTTLLKIISGLIKPTNGELFFGSSNAESLNWDLMREKISVIFQESRLIEGTILENITNSISDYNESRLIKSVEIASIRREIESLPNSYNTLVEGEYKKLSRGQTQRILLARALYKEADIYLFDEATNSINGDIEKKIVSKIDDLLKDKMRIWVTHTVTPILNADVIFVMDRGFIVDYGTHEQLIERKGLYFAMFSGSIGNQDENNITIIPTTN